MLGFFKKKEDVEINSKKSEPDFFTTKGQQKDIDGHSIKNNTNGFKVWRKNNENEEQNKVKSNPEITIEDPLNKDPKEIELETHIGKLVICISEQTENPTVGVGIEVVYITKGSQPMLSVYDIVRKEKTIPTGIIFTYNEQKFDALNQIEANGRVSLFFNRLGTDILDKKSPTNRPLVSAENWKNKVLESIERINRGDWS